MERTFDRITQNPAVLAGRAAIRGLRISVAHVVNLVANGMTPAQVVAELPDLEEEDVRQGRSPTLPRCEVLVNFMYEEINRFLSQSAQPENFDTFFGTTEWRGCVSGSSLQRNRCLHDLYVRQLHNSAGATYVRSFEMKNDAGVTDYYLFYATKSLKGVQKMKEAMWKVDPSGEFKFSDATDPNQMVMFGDPPFEILRVQILERFSKREVTVQEVEEFVLAETAFRETHYKRQVLATLEKSSPPGLIPVNPRPARRPATYGDPMMRIRFATYSA